MLKAFAFTIAIVLLSISSVRAEQIILSKKQIAWIKDNISGKMKDPDSVKFKELKAVKLSNDTGWIDVCGQFNAKNSYGAYVGYKLFHGWITPDGFIAVSFGRSETDDVIAIDTCRSAGLL